MTSLRGVRVCLVTVVIDLQFFVGLPFRESLCVVYDRCITGLVQLCYKCVSVKGPNLTPRSPIFLQMVFIIDWCYSLYYASTRVILIFAVISSVIWTVTVPEKLRELQDRSRHEFCPRASGFKTLGPSPAGAWCTVATGRDHRREVAPQSSLLHNP